MRKSRFSFLFPLGLILGVALFTVLLTLLAIGAAHLFVNDWELVFTANNNGNSTIYLMDVERHLVSSLSDTMINALSPSLSPAANQVAYVSDVSGAAQIYVSGLDGHARRLTSGAYPHTFPSWSPDGKHIAYISHETPGGAIYIFDVDGNNSHLVPLDIPVNNMPRWSPDGTHLLFTSTDKYHHTVLFDGGFLLTETLAANTDDPSHALQGTHRSRETNLYAVTLDGDNHSLTESLAFNTFDPAWSPDGQHIVFLVDDSQGTNIYLLNGAGGYLRRISHDSRLNRCPVWSPDSRHIAFLSQQGGINGLFVMDSDGGNRRMITKSRGTTIYLPVWSPDSQSVAFVLTEKGQNNIYQFGIHNDNQRLLNTDVSGAVFLDKICYSTGV